MAMESSTSHPTASSCYSLTRVNLLQSHLEQVNMLDNSFIVVRSTLVVHLRVEPCLDPIDRSLVEEASGLEPFGLERRVGIEESLHLGNLLEVVGINQVLHQLVAYLEAFQLLGYIMELLPVEPHIYDYCLLDLRRMDPVAP